MRLTRWLAGTILITTGLTASAAAPAENRSWSEKTGAREFVFAARRMNDTDGHWYANIGYYAHDPARKAWREGTKLYRWNAVTGVLTTLIDDPRGGVRDPQIHYDGRKMIFSYRKGGTE